MVVVDGQPRHYDWGDDRAIPELLGSQPDGRPWAEYWWGTHPDAPSTIEGGRPLVDITGPLPYLVKLLAAARPLSLQLHPSAQQAAAGFARDVERRTYRDPWPKPEMVCAITRFEAVSGLAPRPVVESRLAALRQWGARLGQLYRDDGARGVMAWLLHERPDIAAVVDAARELPDPWAMWLARVGDLYPGDPAALALVLMNHVVLKPGQAMFLAAGHLHAYLHGVGLEVMGPSDNVVRGGLTSKTVDADAVLALMRTDTVEQTVVQPERWSSGRARVEHFEVAEAPFVVERWLVDGMTPATASGDELWWCHRGAGAVNAGTCLLVRHGERLVLEAGAVMYRVTTQRRHPMAT